MPPVPPHNQSPMGTGDDKHVAADQGQGKPNAQNPDKIGRQGNIKQNTTNQGYQQDR
jgi:hypothetical protein